MAMSRRGFIKGMSAAMAALMPIKCVDVQANEFDAVEPKPVEPEPEELDYKHLSLSGNGEFVWDDNFIHKPFVKYEQPVCSGCSVE